MELVKPKLSKREIAQIEALMAENAELKQQVAEQADALVELAELIVGE